MAGSTCWNLCRTVLLHSHCLPFLARVEFGMAAQRRTFSWDSSCLQQGEHAQQGINLKVARGLSLAERDWEVEITWWAWARRIEPQAQVWSLG